MTDSESGSSSSEASTSRAAVSPKSAAKSKKHQRSSGDASTSRQSQQQPASSTAVSNADRGKGKGRAVDLDIQVIDISDSDDASSNDDDDDDHARRGSHDNDITINFQGDEPSQARTCEKCTFPAYEGHRCPPDVQTTEAVRQARAERIAQRRDKKAERMSEAAAITERPAKKAKKPKKTKLQKEILRAAKENGNAETVNDGLFFVDTSAGEIPFEIPQQWPATSGSRSTSRRPSPSPVAVSKSSEQKIVPDYLGTTADVQPRVEVLTEDTDRTSHLGAELPLEIEEGELQGDDSMSAVNVQGGASGSREIEAAQQVAKELGSHAPSTDNGNDVGSTTLKQELEDLFSEGDNDDEEERKANPARYWREGDPLLVCHRCGENGHALRSCPHIQCLTCGKLDDHDARSCPLTMTCYRCSSRGHHIKDCPISADQAGRVNLHCERCSSANHSSANCSYIWRVYKRAADAPAPQYMPKYRFACYNCASNLHFGDDCPSPRAHPLKYVDRSAFTADEFAARRRGPQKIRFGSPEGEKRGNDSAMAPHERGRPSRPNIVNGKRQGKMRQTYPEDEHEDDEPDLLNRFGGKPRPVGSAPRPPKAHYNISEDNRKRPQGNGNDDSGRNSDDHHAKRGKWPSDRGDKGPRGNRDSNHTVPRDARQVANSAATASSSKRQDRIRQNGGSSRQPSPPNLAPRLQDRISSLPAKPPAQQRGSFHPLPTVPLVAPAGGSGGKYSGSYF